jgi:hypothetical protein
VTRLAISSHSARLLLAQLRTGATSGLSPQSVPKPTLTSRCACSGLGSRTRPPSHRHAGRGPFGRGQVAFTMVEGRDLSQDAD